MILGLQARLKTTLVTIGLTAALLAWAGAPSPALCADDSRLAVGLGALSDGFTELAAKELWAWVDEAEGDPRAPEVWYILSEIEISRKNWKEADKALEKLAASTSERADYALYRLGQTALSAGDSGLALKRFKAYLAKTVAGDTKRKADAHYELALIHNARAEHAETARELTLFIGAAGYSDPRAPGVEHLLVKSLAASGDTGRAASTALKALKRNYPEDVKLAIALTGADAAARAGNQSAAAMLWGECAALVKKGPEKLRYMLNQSAALAGSGEHGKALEVAEALLADRPASDVARTATELAASSALAAGNDRAAVRHLSALTALKDVDVSKRPRWSLAGFAASLRVGDSAAATRFAGELVAQKASITPEQYGAAAITLARAKEAAGDSSGALALYSSITPGSRYGGEAAEAGGRILLEGGEHAAALALLTKRLKAAKGLDDSGELRALTLIAAEGANDHEAALGVIDSLLANPPGVRDRDKSAAVSGAKEARAELLLRRYLHLNALERKAQARKTLETLGADYPSTKAGESAMMELLGMAFDEGRWEDVLTLVEKVRPSGEELDEVIYMKAEAEWHTGKRDDAAPLYMKLIERGAARGGEAAARLGAHAESKGVTGLAIAHYKKALELGVPDSIGQWVRSRLEKLE